MRNNFIKEATAFRERKKWDGKNRPCLCYCRTWFYEGVHNGKFLILWMDEVVFFKAIKENDFDVIATG